jgi:hypothetical protein
VSAHPPLRPDTPFGRVGNALKNKLNAVIRDNKLAILPQC